MTDLPDYDLDALIEQRKRIVAGIADIEQALEREREKKARFDALIGQAEVVLEEHGRHACVRGVKPHKWEVLDRFMDGQHRGRWRRRRCLKCKTVQQLGEPDPAPR